MNHLSLLLQPTTVPGRIRTTDSVPAIHPTPSEIFPSAGAEETRFALNHYLTPRTTALGQALEKAKQDGKPHKILLAVKVLFISVIPFTQWEMQYCQLFPKARQSCLSTESSIFMYFHYERSFTLLSHHTASHIGLPPDHLEITLINYVSNQ